MFNFVPHKPCRLGAYYMYQRSVKSARGTQIKYLSIYLY